MDAGITFRWLGVAGVEVCAANHVLAIDPYFTRIPFWRLWIGRVRPNSKLIVDRLPRCDVVLVTHAHFDHLMDVPEVIRHTGATALGSPNTCRLLASCGVPVSRIREIGVGSTFTLGEFHVEVLDAVPSLAPGFAPRPVAADLRPPLHARDYRMDASYAFLISIGPYRFLTDPGERPVETGSTDVLFVAPHFDVRHHGYARPYYEALLRKVRPKLVVPIHWDDLFRPLAKPVRPYFYPPAFPFFRLHRQNLLAFRSMIERMAAETQVLVPEMFRSYALDVVLDRGTAQQAQPFARM